MNDPKIPTSVGVEDLLRWSGSNSPMIQVRTREAALPSELAVAMAPSVVDWAHSDSDLEGGSFLVRNVNVGGNPIAGKTTLATVRVPSGGVVEAEYVIVTYKRLGLETPAGHAQLRLVFHHDQRPVILGRDGEPLSNDAELEDLIFSWEAWRPPGEDFDPQKGLQTGAFQLTMRCFDGAQRFLEDSLRNRNWKCYTLDLPGKNKGLARLLENCLKIGDAQARHCLSEMIDGELEDENAADTEAWKVLESRLRQAKVPFDAIVKREAEDVEYQLVKRSCITMGLGVIDLTARAMGHTERVQVTPEDLPDWMDELARGNKRTILRLLPSTLWWISRHQDVLPLDSWKLLEEARLLEIRLGEVACREYELSEETPYGPLKGNIMY